MLPAGYPIVWGLAEGSNTITADAEAASYAGLDIAAKVVFGWALMLCTPVFHRALLEAEKCVLPILSPLVNQTVSFCPFLPPRPAGGRKVRPAHLLCSSIWQKG